MDLWNTLWLAGGALFAVLELVAWITKRRTFSRQMWNWFSWREHRQYWLLRRVIFVGTALSVVIGHLVLFWPAFWSVVLPLIPFTAVIVYSLSQEKPGPGSRTLLDEGEDMLKRIWYAFLYGGIASLAPVAMAKLFCETCVPPRSFVEAWPMVAAFVVGFYAKFSSSQTFVTPNRPVWTEERRFEERNKA